MYWRRYWYTGFWLHVGWEITHWRRRLVLFWYGADKAPWLFVLFLAGMVAALGFALYTAVVYQAERRHQVREFHQQSIHCLARNVYFEARGEPLAGQYAVAEVTMNRRGWGPFRKSVCAVVYEPGAFSWTSRRRLPQPLGKAWERARHVAEMVYWERRTPALGGARYYHAVYVNPDWAKDHRRIARIGQHIFYR